MLQSLKKILRADAEKFYKEEKFTDHTSTQIHTHTHTHTHTHIHTNNRNKTFNIKNIY